MNYSETPVTDPKQGQAEKARKDDRARERRLSRSVIIVIIVALVAACGAGAWIAIDGHGPARGTDDAVQAQDANAATGTDEASQNQDGVDSTPAGSETGSLGAATDLAVTADKDNGLTAGGIGATVESATLAKDQGGHGWVTVRFRLANPGSDPITLGDGGLELLASQGDAPLAWDSSCLKAWKETTLDGGGAKEVDMRFALASDTDPLTLAVTRSGATMGWTVDVADAASGIVPLGVSA